MNNGSKIVLIVGLSLLFGGSMMATIFGLSFQGIDDADFAAIIPASFAVVGLCMTIGALKNIIKTQQVRRKGRKIQAKIYGYIENKSYMVNNSYPINVKARYMDTSGTVRETILNTSFPHGSDAYPIGYTIDIFEYKGMFTFDKSSVREQYIPFEEELMDNKPLDPEKITFVGVTCPNCGSSFKAKAGYTNNCPYCGSAINA